MAALIVKHRVADFDTWKKVFDALAPTRKEHGWTGHSVLRDAADPNLVTVVHRMRDVASAKRYAASPELRAAMAGGGVQGSPEVSFAEDGGEVTYASEHLTPERIMQVGLGFWGSKTLLSAIELGVFGELAKAPEDLATLRDRLGLHPRSAADFLDALVSLGFLRRSGGKYANTPETDLFLDRSKPSYVGGMLEMANHRLFRFWNNLTVALKTGEPQNEITHGGEFFAALYADPARLREFLRAMTGLSHGANLAVARALPWKDYKSFVDVGTAQGDLAVQIALANPHLSGTGFDLPSIAPVFEEYAAQTGTSGRLTFAPGDFFRTDLPRADVVLMGHILHDWDLAEKKTLIKKAYDALPPGGALVVYEAMIDDDRSKNAFGLLMSLNMLIETQGGFDYTSADCIGWMKDAGFRDARAAHLVGPDSMVVAIK